MSLTPYQTLDSGPICRPFLRVNGKMSRNWQGSRGEWSLSRSVVPHRSSTLLLCTHGQSVRSSLPWRNSKGTTCIYLALIPPFYLCLERVISPWLCDTSRCSALPPGSRYRVNVNVGHEGAQVFLKASYIINYPAFNELLNPESTLLRYKLAEERRELRERYRSKAKASRKGKFVECIAIKGQ